MGCTSAKAKKSLAPEPENIRASYKEPNQTLIDVKNFQFIEFDSRLPMTKRQIFSLLQSWRGIRRDMASVGTDMIVELLHSDPDVQNVFTIFRDLETKSEMQSSEKVETLGLKVMEVLDDVAIRLDEYDRVMTLLRRVASMHSKWMGGQPEMFKMIKQPFLKAVHRSLGDRFTDHIETIYEIFIDFVIAETIAALSSYEAETSPVTE